MEPTQRFLQSYVQDRYFVSTVYRRSSTLIEIWYYETIVWEWNNETKKRGKIIDTEDSGRSKNIAIENHMHICKKLIKLLGQE